MPKAAKPPKYDTIYDGTKAGRFSNALELAFWTVFSIIDNQREYMMCANAIKLINHASNAIVRSTRKQNAALAER